MFNLGEKSLLLQREGVNTETHNCLNAKNRRLSQRWNLYSNKYQKKTRIIHKKEREEWKSWRKGTNCCERVASGHSKAVVHTSQHLWLSHLRLWTVELSSLFLKLFSYIFLFFSPSLPLSFPPSFAPSLSASSPPPSFHPSLCLPFLIVIKNLEL